MSGPAAPAVSYWTLSSRCGDGLALAAIAPFAVVVIAVNSADSNQVSVAEAIYQQACSEGLDALLDDRSERAGVKFKDADLIGPPIRITVGRKVTSGEVEILDRSTKQTTDVKIDTVSEFLRNLKRAKDLNAQRGTRASNG